LTLSFFTEAKKRITADLAARRNEFIAALTDDVFVARATPGGRLETSLRQSALSLNSPQCSAKPENPLRA